MMVSSRVSQPPLHYPGVAAVLGRVEPTRRMHGDANYEAADGTARQMQRRPFFHPQVFYQPPLGEEVRRQLDRAPKARSDHGSSNTAVQPGHALAPVYPTQAIPRIAVIVLRPHRAERRIAL